MKTRRWGENKVVVGVKIAFVGVKNKAFVGVKIKRLLG